MPASTTNDTRAEQLASLVEALRRDSATVWRRPPQAAASPIGISQAEISDAKARFERFGPVLAALFPDNGWDGRIRSPLKRADERLAPGWPNLFLKADCDLPMTGSVKARGGVHELLCWLEDYVVDQGILAAGEDPIRLLEPRVREQLKSARIVVASTGNLGFSIGLVARAFGCDASVHMSRDAKAWKKDRLRAIGANVIEHAGDYAQAVASARVAATLEGAYFVDDENSRRLFVGYAAAADELGDQLLDLGLDISPERPLVVYLPCGVGGAPGGVTAGLRYRFADAVIPVFVEPTRSACVLLALASGNSACSVYEVGLDNDTIADGLAVPQASPLVLDLVGDQIEAVVAVNDQAMAAWVRRAWDHGGVRLEPSAAAALAALAPLRSAQEKANKTLPQSAVHVAWLTGGSLLPDAEFATLLSENCG